MPAPEKVPHSVRSISSRRTENLRKGRTLRRRRRRRRLPGRGPDGLDLSEGAVKLYVMGRIAAAAVLGAALTAAVGVASPGAARAGGDLQAAVPNVPAQLPEPFTVMLFENRSGVQGL